MQEELIPLLWHSYRTFTSLRPFYTDRYLGMKPVVPENHCSRRSSTHTHRKNRSTPENGSDTHAMLLAGE